MRFRTKTQRQLAQLQAKRAANSIRFSEKDFPPGALRLQCTNGEFSLFLAEQKEFGRQISLLADQIRDEAAQRR